MRVFGALVGKLKAAGVPEHVWVTLKLNLAAVVFAATCRVAFCSGFATVHIASAAAGH